MQNLSKESIDNLKRILADQSIDDSLLYNDKKPGIKHLNADGSLILGSTSNSWWNRFIGCEKNLSFNDLAIHIIDIMAGIGPNRNYNALDGMYQDYINFALKEKDKDKVVKSLIISFLFGYKKVQSEGGEPSPRNLFQVVTETNTQREFDGLLLHTASGPKLFGKDGVFYDITCSRG